MNPAARKMLTFAGLVAFSFFLYWSCRNAGFIWDDRFLVTANPLIRSPILAVEAFRHFLGEEPPSNFFRPVQTLSYLVDYCRGGLNPTVYHDGNTLLHGLNAALFSVFIRGLLRRKTQVSENAASLCGLMGALLWISHPIHSATVAYIAGRADSLALCFLLTCWCLWDAFLRKRHWVIAFLIFVAGFGAICSKEAALTGLGIFLLAAMLSRNQLSRNEKVAVFGGCVALIGIYLALRLSIAPGEAPPPMQPQGNRVLLMLRALGDYGRLLIFPGNLRMERQVAQVPNLFTDPAAIDPFYPYLAWAGVLFAAFLGFSIFRKGNCLQVRRFGALWFIAFFLPISNLIILNATVAEHWLYIPSIGFFLILIGWALETGRRTQRVLVVVACLAIAGLSWRTKLRAEDWTSPITFFESTIRDGGDTARMRVSLAYEYQQQGNLEKGESILSSVLALSPGYAQARHALFVNLILQGRRPEADLLYGNETEPFGDSFRGRLYAAQRLTHLGEVKESAKKLKKLHADFPESWLVRKEMGLLFDKVGQPEEKLRLYKDFAERHWWHAESHLEMAKLLESQSKNAEAAKAYREAADLDVHDTVLSARARSLENQP